MISLNQKLKHKCFSFACRNHLDIKNLGNVNQEFHNMIFKDLCFSLDISKLFDIRNNPDYDHLHPFATKSKLSKKIYTYEQLFSCGDKAFEILMDGDYSDHLGDDGEICYQDNLAGIVNPPCAWNILNKIQNNGQLAEKFFQKFFNTTKDGLESLLWYYSPIFFSGPDIDMLKKLRGTISGDFALSMYTKEFSADVIPVFYDDDQIFYEDAKPGISLNYQSETISNVYLLKKNIYLYLSRVPVKEMIADLFIFDSEQIIWDPNLENPFSRNNPKLLDRIDRKITLCNFSGDRDHNDCIKFWNRGFEIIPVFLEHSWEYRKDHPKIEIREKGSFIIGKYETAKTYHKTVEEFKIPFTVYDEEEKRSLIEKEQLEERTKLFNEIKNLIEKRWPMGYRSGPNKEIHYQTIRITVALEREIKNFRFEQKQFLFICNSGDLIYLN